MSICTSAGFSLEIHEQKTEPFRYFIADQCLDVRAEQAMLDWFEGGAPWRLVETDFYEQYEFSLFDAALPDHLRHLVSDTELTLLRRSVEQALGCRLRDQIEIVAHKLVPGQRIAIHNDYLVGGETHRLTVQLNRGLNDDDGGFFMLFNSFDANDVHRILRPASNTGIGFEISAASHHAVSRLHGGTRYTLVYSFHAEREAGA